MTEEKKKVGPPSFSRLQLTGVHMVGFIIAYYCVDLLGVAIWHGASWSDGWQGFFTYAMAVAVGWKAGNDVKSAFINYRITKWLETLTDEELKAAKKMARELLDREAKK